MNWKRHLAGLGVLVFAASAAAQTNTPLFQFAIFYNGLLEFSTCSTMTVNGRTHANGDIYTGSSAPLTFNSTVTTGGTISSPGGNGQGPDWAYKGTFNGTPAFRTNAPAFALFIGSGNPHAIIDMPPNGEDPNSTLGQRRYYNQAQTVLLVSNTTVTMKIQASLTDRVPGADPAPLLLTSTSIPTALATNFPFLITTNTFTDQREAKTVLTTQIDIGKYAAWIKTNASILSKFPAGSGTYPTILYVADNRTTTASQITAVRLTNGIAPPVNGGLGWSVATPDPLYVWGHYNCTNSAYLGTTNTTSSVPCAFISDALTILSGAWQDSKSINSYTARQASATTLNAAILTGIVPSTGSTPSTFSGGVHNLPRLLEDWNTPSTRTLTLNTSLASLFNSEVATHQFVNPGTYYDPPIRQFSFDQSFLNYTKLPPGTPLLVQLGPDILTPPQDQTATAGQTAVFNVLATGTPLPAYYWLFNSTLIPGATNSTLTITNASADNVGLYSVLVFNLFGGLSSPRAALTVNYPAVISAQPVSQAAVPGTDVTFAVSAGGTAPLGYQWWFNGSAVAGATNSSLMVGGVQSSNIGSYSVVVTNVAGSVTSSPANLSLANPPDFLWARSVSNGAPAGVSRADSMAADVFGNILVAGSFTTATLDFGGGVLTNDSWSGGSIASFICQYDGVGNLLWVRPAGTNSGFAWPLRVGTDAFGNAYLAGRFAGTATFGTNTLVSSTPADLFVAKYDSQGQVLWVRQIGAYQNMPSSSYSGFAVDAAGNAFVACPDGGSANFGGVTLANSTGFLAKYDPAGNLVWAREALGAVAIALGTNGAVCLVGVHGILAKYDNQGTLAWSRSFPHGLGIVLDAQENIYTTGFGAGTYDGFTFTNSAFFAAKCDPSGHLQWLRQVGGVQQQEGSAIGLDEFDNVYVTSLSGLALPEPALTFGTNVLTNVFTFAAKYDPAGNPLWARALTTTTRAAMFALAVKDSADVYVGGCFSGIASMGTLSLSNAYPCSGSFSEPCSLGMFVAKLDGTDATAPPAITVGPQDQVVMAGGDVTFSVTVPRGIPLSYQWFHDQTNAIAGATGSSLFLSNVQLTNAGSYSVVVSNAYGWVSSEAASLTVIHAILVVGSPVSATNCPGTSASFRVDATGEGLSYQWYHDSSALAGQTDSSLALSSVSAADAGTYSVLVRDAFANAVTNNASLTVNQNVAVAVAPVSVTNCPGTSASFSVSATGTGLSYQWYKGTTALTGQAGSSLVLGSVSAADAGTYSVTVSGICGSPVSQSATLTVNESVAVSIAPASATNCPGTSASFGVSATGTRLSYQWYKGSAALTGQTGSSLVLGSVSAADAGTYSVTVSGSCGSPVSRSATLTVNENLAVSSAPTSVTNCPGTSASFAVSATGTRLSYQWYKGSAVLVSQTGSSLVLADVSAADAGTYSVVVSGTCGNAVSNSASLTVNQNVAVSIVPVSVTNCPGTTAGFNVSATGTGLSYQWYKDTTALVGQTGSSLVLANVSAVDAGTYSVMVSGTCGNAMTNSASLTVNQNVAVAIAPVSLTNCPGTSATFSVDATGTGLSYHWYKGGNALADETDSRLLLNSVSVADAGTYSVVVSDVCGNTVTNSASLTVNPSVVVVSARVNLTNCPGTSATFSVNATGTGLGYQWYKGGGALAGQTSSRLIFGSVSASQAGAYSVVIRDVCGNSVTNSANLTVCVAPTISAAPQSLTLCVGQNAVFEVGAAGTERLVYQWQFNGTNLVAATNATLILTNVTTDQAGAYGITVTNLAGIASASATCSVYSTTAAVLKAPPSQTGGRFQFTITGVPGFNYALEASTNLVDWVPLSTNTSPCTFTDDQATNVAARYYRSVYLP